MFSHKTVCFLRWNFNRTEAYGWCARWKAFYDFRFFPLSFSFLFVGVVVVIATFFMRCSFIKEHKNWKISRPANTISLAMIHSRGKSIRYKQYVGHVTLCWTLDEPINGHTCRATLPNGRYMGLAKAPKAHIEQIRRTQFGCFSSPSRTSALNSRFFASVRTEILFIGAIPFQLLFSLIFSSERFFRSVSLECNFTTFAKKLISTSRFIQFLFRQFPVFSLHCRVLTRKMCICGNRNGTREDTEFKFTMMEMEVERLKSIFEAFIGKIKEKAHVCECDSENGRMKNDANFARCC